MTKLTKGVTDQTSEVLEFVVIIISLIIMVFVSWYIYKKAQGEADKIMEFRKSSAIARKSKSRVGNSQGKPTRFTLPDNEVSLKSN